MSTRETAAQVPVMFSAGRALGDERGARLLAERSLAESQFARTSTVAQEVYLAVFADTLLERGEHWDLHSPELIAAHDAAVSAARDALEHPASHLVRP